MTSEHRLRASNRDREEVVEVLTTAHAEGRLDDAELEQRREDARAVTYVDELLPLVVDLPEGQALHTDLEVRSGKEIALYEPAALASTSGNVPAVPGHGSDETAVAIMSGRDIDVVPGTSTVRNFCLMGGNDIDLTRVMGPGVEVTLECYSMWGGNDIVVPPGVRIIDKMISVMAGNDINKSARGDGSNGTLILTGFQLMAGNAIKLARGKTPPPPQIDGRDLR